MRAKIWDWVTKGLPEEMMLPRWAIVARAMLFPLDFFYWRMSRGRGYQAMSDTWIIEGVRYHHRSFRYLSKADGWVFRITRVGDTVRFERIIEEDSEWLQR